MSMSKHQAPLASLFAPGKYQGILISYSSAVHHASEMMDPRIHGAWGKNNHLLHVMAQKHRLQTLHVLNAEANR